MRDRTLAACAAYRWEEPLLRQLTIRTKESLYAPLALNPGQRLVWQAMRRQRAQGRPVRVVVLKARQFGGSTLAQACLFADTFFRPGRESWIVAHTNAGAQALFGISARFLAFLPAAAGLQVPISNQSRLVLPGDSRITAATAATAPAGRGFTLHNLHASEVAFWARARDTMLALLQAVPDHPDTCVIVESTACGLGGYFYDLWRAARAGENGFAPVFVGWNSVAEYALPFAHAADRAAFLDTLDADEAAMRQVHGLRAEQLFWRRACLRDKCAGSPDAFRQEYPLHDQEAFLTSGRPVFSVPALERLYARCHAPVRRAEIAVEDFLAARAAARAARDPGTLSLESYLKPAPDGRLLLWRAPEPGAAYVIGADVAEGIETGPGGHDNSCVQVLHRGRFEQVACWTGRIDPDALADVILFLAEFYNQALAGVEANNHGLTTLTMLKHRYPHLYRREVYDERSRRRTRKLGWLTTAASRPLMLDALGRVVREGDLAVHDRETVSECLTFVYDRNGRMAAQEGCRDDRVFALALAVQMHLRTPWASAPTPSADAVLNRLAFLAALRRAAPGAAREGWNIV